MKKIRLIAAGVLLLVIAGVSSSQAASRVWQPTAGTNDWSNPANWDGGTSIPAAGDDVTVASAGVALLTSSTPYFNSLTLSKTLTFSNWNSALSATHITIQSNGVMTCAGPFNNTDMSNRVYVVCSNLTILSAGRINVDAKGYLGSMSVNIRGCGPGGGTNGGGGAHGGFGGRGGYTPAGGNYPCGNPLAPVLPGSGGGAVSTSGAEGGPGGGAVRIVASGEICIDGILSANGGTRIVGQASGGSGGSIYITCCTLVGTNQVTANGGDCQVWGAPGAGGRIAVDYNATAQSNAVKPSLRFSVLPGTGGYSQQSADIGTVYVHDSSLLGEPINVSGQVLMDVLSWAPSRLTVSNNWVRFPQEGFHLTVTNDLVIAKGSLAGRLEIGASVLTNFNTPNPTGAGSAKDWTYRFFAATSAPVLSVGGNLTLTNSGSLVVYSAPTNGSAPAYGSLVEVAGDMKIGIGCWVYPYSHWSNGGSPLFKMRSLTIATNAGFNADMGGFAGGSGAGPSAGYNGFGPGGGWAASPTYLTLGGSYGGLGGRVTDSNRVYGSSNAPALPGSGGMGGLAGGILGGFGGGLVRIEASGTITLDGTLSAVGGVNGGAWDAGGSGGGIYLTCDTFKGSTNGVLRASAGTGYSSACGGGGGRIAIWRIRDTSSGPVSNTADGGGNGQAGTVVWGWLLDLGPVFVVF